jgi:hypothetical protein
MGKKYAMPSVRDIKLSIEIPETLFRAQLIFAQMALSQGRAIKVRTMLNEAQTQHIATATEQMYRFAEALKEKCVIQTGPQFVGKCVIMVLSPEAPPPPKADLADSPNDPAPVPRRPLPKKGAGEIALPEPVPENET